MYVYMCVGDIEKLCFNTWPSTICITQNRNMDFLKK